MKHLKVLEDENLVVSYEEKSTLGGPPRKSYESNKRISLRIDVGPSTFRTEIFDFTELENEIGSEDKEIPSEQSPEKKDEAMEHLLKEFEECLNLEDPNEKLTKLSKLVQNITQELEELKLKRSKLLTLEERVSMESNKLIGELCQQYNDRKILYYLLMHNDRNVSTISEVMGMREKVIREIFQKLIRQQLLDLEEDLLEF